MNFIFLQNLFAQSLYKLLFSSCYVCNKQLTTRKEHVCILLTGDQTCYKKLPTYCIYQICRTYQTAYILELHGKFCSANYIVKFWISRPAKANISFTFSCTYEKNLCKIWWKYEHGHWAVGVNSSLYMRKQRQHGWFSWVKTAGPIVWKKYTGVYIHC